MLVQSIVSHEDRAKQGISDLILIRKKIKKYRISVTCRLVPLQELSAVIFKANSGNPGC